MKRKSQQGVALVITLILLSVITFMAVTFLVVSRHEGAQVNTLTQENTARLAAQQGLAQAQSLVIAQMLGHTNGLNFDLQVSTNFSSGTFYNPSKDTGKNLTNVSYYDSSGALLTGVNLQNMLANQIFSPRPPVFIVTNKAFPNKLDFRFYLDLNRNGIFDTNGWVAEIKTNGQPAVDSNGKQIFKWRTGDPEWIGILSHPDQRHSPSNLYVARYCYIALPIGNSLDLDYIHNQSLETQMLNGQEGGYLRNQGVGTWEINLAGFLNALNPNIWNGYSYHPISTGLNSAGNSGNAFNDAAAIVQYRYNRNYTNLSGFLALYPQGTNYLNDFIDGFSVGPVMTNLQPLTVERERQIVSKLPSFPWSGADNPNPFFSSQDLFANIPGPAGTPFVSFTNNLFQAGRLVSTEDKYTYYRMLSQLSVGSAPEPVGSYPFSPKMNLNYANVGGLSATNFQPWKPLQFFTNAVDRMLKATFPNPIVYTNGLVVYTNYLSITNIPIYPVNLYTPAVHRIVQLAANIYDSSVYKVNSNNPTADFDYPSVFRPTFIRIGTNIFITGYQEITTNMSVNPLEPRITQGDLPVTSPPRDLRRAGDLQFVLRMQERVPFNANFYGIPYVIGAKQGFPTFNKFTTAPVIEMFRKLQLVKPSAGAAPGPGWQTNVQYTIGISNVFGADCWYSSTNTYYGRRVVIYVTNDFSIYLTNNVGIPTYISNNISGTALSVPTNSPFTWFGSPNMALGTKGISSSSFKVPLQGDVVVLNDSILHLNPRQFVSSNDVISRSFETTPVYFTPSFGLIVTNRIRLMMVDFSTGRIIDYVQLGGLGQLAGLDSYNNINNDLQNLDSTQLPQYQLWLTNAPSGKNLAPQGWLNQIALSQNGSPPAALWTSASLPPGTSIADAQTKFKNFFLNQDGGEKLISAQAPLVAYAKYQKTTTWSVNDPLVHYMVSDLTDQTQATNQPVRLVATPTNALAGILRTVTTNRYQPWGLTSSDSQLRLVRGNEIAYKDPLVTYGDAWQFPTYKFPNIGWLGRVHRGTPWQTMYLKSQPVEAGTWSYWTGDTLTNYLGVLNDAAVSVPASDWLLLDLFTTAPNENASRGQLSVNQTNAASWAAVLDGVNILGANFIDPTNYVTVNGTNFTTVQYMVNSINSARTNFLGGVFTSVGQILSVPQLTVASPYLNVFTNSQLSDAAYERIPQQIMSLLRVGTPRYVIFAYGQSLKPADHSIVQTSSGGQIFGMCTNYQITGEVATRTVVRFENQPIPGKGRTTPQAIIESYNVLPPDQ